MLWRKIATVSLQVSTNCLILGVVYQISFNSVKQRSKLENFFGAIVSITKCKWAKIFKANPKKVPEVLGKNKSFRKKGQKSWCIGYGIPLHHLDPTLNCTPHFQPYYYVNWASLAQDLTDYNNESDQNTGHFAYDEKIRYTNRRLYQPNSASYFH